MATSGFIDFAHGHDLPSAARKLQTARQLDPASDKPRLWLAHLELVTGHSESAFAEIDAAQRASPTNPLVFASVGWLRLLDGRIGEALEWGAEATVRFEDFSPGRLIYGLALEGAGRYEEAEREFLAARDIALGPPRQSTGHALVPMAALGHLYATTRRRTGAREILEWLVALRRDRFVSSYLTALVRVGLGEADAALDDLARARIERCDWLVHLVLDPRWRPLRRRRRFAALVASLGLGEPR
jgi:tetratricopeptide (TPR) repeat protein